MFRREAIFHATQQRLSGPVVLATPLSARCLGAVMAAIVLGAVIFVSMASYARKATVTGWLVPDQGLIRATASSGGFILSLGVKEGDRIEQGAKLAEIRIAADTAAGNVGEQAIAQLRAEAEAAKAKAQSQIERLDAESVQAAARLGKLRDELHEVQMQAELQDQRVHLARQEAKRSEDLASRGLLSLRDRDARRGAVLSAEQEMATQRRLISSTERDIADVTARLSAIVIEKATAAAESRAAEANLEQRMNDAEAHRVQFVLSPVAGRVAALPVAAGQPISPGGTVAVVIPDGARLEAELLAPSSAAGFIRPGQETRLMLQAFPHQRFGTVKGSIKTISRTVLGPTEISIPGLKIEEPVFRVRVALAREDIHAYGEAIPLQPGMLLTADVVFDRRSLIRWLFDPLFAVAERS
ncbi:MAG TPA: HlyD family efflux transporter periplasmic adaptor subunit [Xanthobacteraceae bacterium]